jgi:hypothetical protein
VRLQLQEVFGEHPHVIRLRVKQAPGSTPPTVIVKISRIAGQSPDCEVGSHNAFFRDWASLEFLQSILGDEKVAPRIFTGNINEGYFVMEDLGNGSPLENALWNGAFPEALQAMSQYGAMMGLLHGVSVGKNDLFNIVCDKMMAGYNLESENFHHHLEKYIADMSKLEIIFPAPALNELWDAAEVLTRPGNLNVFTHGDPVGGNILGAGDLWRWIDFEAGRFQNGLIEGVYPRMMFPTSGLTRVMGVPEMVWRVAEAAYRSKLGEYIPEVKDEAVFGRSITAACAFWLLDTCAAWLSHALAGGFSAERVSRVRQCVIDRIERFIITSHEFHRMTRLCEEVEKLARRFRSQWPDADCELPFYPAFL